MTGRVRDMIMDPEQTGKLVEVISSGGYYGMQTFDQALFGHVKAGRVTFEDAYKVASSPHDFKLLMQADGRRGTTMDDVAAAEAKRDEAASPPAQTSEPLGAARWRGLGVVEAIWAVIALRRYAHVSHRH